MRSKNRIIVLWATTLAALAVGMVASAQNLDVKGTTTSESNAYFYQSVGIGTTSPQGALHVANTPALIGGTLNNWLRMGYYANIYNTGKNATVINAGEWGLPLSIETTAGLWVPNGNVGIGTTSPADALHVTSGGWTGLRVVDSTAAYNVRLTPNQLTANGGPLYLSWDSQTNTIINGRSGNVGIGTASPSAKLSVGGSLGGTATSTTFNTYAGSLGTSAGNELVLGSLGFASANQSSLGIHAYRTAAGTDWTTTALGLGMDVDNTWRAGGAALWLNANGNVGIGTASPDNLLTVNGTADKPGGGSWGTFSDARLKDVKGEFTAGLDELLRLHPVRYQYKKHNALGIRDEVEHVGFVAQEVERVIPEAVSKNSRGYRIVNNDPILWTMLNAIKAQQAQIRALKAENDRLHRVESEIEEIKAAVLAMKAARQPNRLAVNVRAGTR